MLQQENRLILMAGVTGLAGSILVILAHFLTLYLLDPFFNPVTETISDLAAGHHGWIMDSGLVLYGLGLIACALGLYLWGLEENFQWQLGLALLLILGLDVILIATYNEYGNLEEGGVEIHIYLVYVLGISFALVVGLLGTGLRHIHRHLRWWSIGLACVWLLLAPPFLLFDMNWDGLYERILAAFMLGWTLALSWLLIRRGYRGHGSLT